MHEHDLCMVFVPTNASIDPAMYPVAVLLPRGAGCSCTKHEVERGRPLLVRVCVCVQLSVHVKVHVRVPSSVAQVVKSAPNSLRPDKRHAAANCSTCATGRRQAGQVESETSNHLHKSSPFLRSCLSVFY